MNVRFTKTVAVDFEECRTNEVFDRTFNRGQVVRDVALEEISRNFVNLHFTNGDLAISVPKTAIEEN